MKANIIVIRSDKVKKILFLIIIFIFSISFVNAKEKESSIIKNARSGVLIDASSGEVLFEKNKDNEVAVASMTKMVAQIIILENIENGSIKWEDVVTASSNASGMGGSQIYLQTGEKMTVRDLMKGITMATVAMAEYISGTEEEFVKLMNDKVKQLGLKNTVFKNSTGLDEPGHYSSAHDMARIAKELLTHEQILEFSKIYEDYLRTDTQNKFWLVNTNKLVRFYEGADGLKTGFTDNAGYCMAVTAKRNNMRLIAIVLGEESGKVRNNETMELLDYGFNTYKVDLIKSKNDKVATVKLDKSNIENVDIYPKEDITILGKKTDPSLKYDLEIKIDKIDLPIKKNTKVGRIIVKNNNKVVREVSAVIRDNLEKKNFIDLLGQTIKDIVTGDLL